MNRVNGKVAFVTGAAMGIGRAGAPETSSMRALQAWRELLEINLDGVFLGIKRAIPPMRDAGGGSIINLSSIEGLIGDPALAAESKFMTGAELVIDGGYTAQ